jgi:hypothetical protein
VLLAPTLQSLWGDAWPQKENRVPRRHRKRSGADIRISYYSTYGLNVWYCNVPSVSRFQSWWSRNNGNTSRKFQHFHNINYVEARKCHSFVLGNGFRSSGTWHKGIFWHTTSIMPQEGQANRRTDKLFSRI